MQTPTFYDTLFGDMPLADWAAHGDRLEAEPWPAFAEAAKAIAGGGIASACRILRAVTQLPGIETRHVLQAWSALREFHCPEARNAEKEALGVVIEAAHQCMTTRGVKKPGVTMVTSRMLGAFRDDQSTRREFMALIASNATHLANH